MPDNYGYYLSRNSANPDHGKGVKYFGRQRPARISLSRPGGRQNRFALFSIRINSVQFVLSNFCGDLYNYERSTYTRDLAACSLFWTARTQPQRRGLMWKSERWFYAAEIVSLLPGVTIRTIALGALIGKKFLRGSSNQWLFELQSTRKMNH